MSVVAYGTKKFVLGDEAGSSRSAAIVKNIPWLGAIGIQHLHDLRANRRTDTVTAQAKPKTRVLSIGVLMLGTTDL